MDPSSPFCEWITSNKCIHLWVIYYNKRRTNQRVKFSPININSISLLTDLIEGKKTKHYFRVHIITNIILQEALHILKSLSFQLMKHSAKSCALLSTDQTDLSCFKTHYINYILLIDLQLTYWKARSKTLLFRHMCCKHTT